MIYCLTGKVVKKTLDTVVLSCGGVGYLAQVTSSVAGVLPAVGGEATLYTVMNVTENDVSLFGFASEAERECFLLLISVSGVGPKVGLAILNVLTPDRIALAISAGDHQDQLAEDTLRDHALLLEFFRKRDAAGAEHAMAIHMHHSIDVMGLRA